MTACLLLGTQVFEQRVAYRAPGALHVYRVGSLGALGRYDDVSGQQCDLAARIARARVIKRQRRVELDQGRAVGQAGCIDDLPLLVLGTEAIRSAPLDDVASGRGDENIATGWPIGKIPIRDDRGGAGRGVCGQLGPSVLDGTAV